MRDLVWSNLINFKFKGYCLDIILERFQRYEMATNIFLAIASSGSIAAWVIWKDYPLVWSSIIVLSQIVTVIKPYLPYNKYIKEINAKCVRLELLQIEMEQLWYKIQHEKITEDECAEQFFYLRKQSVEILNFADDTIFSVGTKMEKEANQKTAVYFKTNYNVDITIS